MTSLVTETPILLAPNPYADSPVADTVTVRAGVFNQITVTGNIEIDPPATLNGGTINGIVVTTTGIQTLTNKSLSDATTFIVNSVDATKKVGFNVNVSAATTSTLQFNATASRTYIFPDPGASPANIILSQGTQSITGATTFTTSISINSLWSIVPIAQITTPDATATAIYTGSISSGSVIYYTVFITSTTATNASAHRASAVFKNVGGIVTLASQFDSWDSGDAGLGGATLTWLVSGNNPVLNVTGLLATNINWKGAVQYTSGTL